MATQTIEPTTKLAENDPVTQVVSPETETLSPYFGSMAPVQTEEAREMGQAASAFEESAYTAGQMPKECFLGTIGKQMVRFYDWLTGPPQTDLDRAATAHIKAKNCWTKHW